MADQSQAATLTIRLVEDGSSGGAGQGGSPPFPAVRPVPKPRRGGSRSYLTPLIQGAGRAGQAVASNQALAAGQAGFAGLAPLIGAVPEIGVPLAAAGTAALGMAKAFKDVTEAFIDRGRELARFSPLIAIAGAQARIRGVQQDIREAQALQGPEARLIDVWSEFTVEIRQILLPIKKAVVEIIADLLEAMKKILEDLAGPITHGIEALAAIALGMEKLLLFDRKGAIEQIAKATIAIVQIMNKAKKAPEPPDFLDEFLKIGSQGLPDFSKKPPPKPAEGLAGKLGLPLFGGLP